MMRGIWNFGSLYCLSAMCLGRTNIKQGAMVAVMTNIPNTAKFPAMTVLIHLAGRNLKARKRPNKTALPMMGNLRASCKTVKFERSAQILLGL